MSPGREGYLKELKQYAKESGSQALVHFKRVIKDSDDAERLKRLHEELAEVTAKYSSEANEAGRAYRGEEMAYIKAEIDTLAENARLETAWERIAAKNFLKDVIVGGIKKFLPVAKDLALKHGLEFAKDIGGVL
jgi:hypothetical protein